MRVRIIFKTSIAVVFAICSLLLAAVASRIMMPAMGEQNHVDLRMRCNEARCVRAGVDPYLLWKGRCCHADYVPWDFVEAIGHPERVASSNYVHAYPPWCYSLIMPLSFLNDVVAIHIWLVIQWLLLVLATCLSFLIVYRSSKSAFFGILTVAAVWLLGSPILMCLLYGNYGVIVACSVAGAIGLHVKKRDGLAGLCWVLASLKPQVSVLFIVPLLCMRKWKTLFVLGGAILILTLIPALLCHRSPIDMVACISDYSSAQFFETGFIAKPVFVKLVEDGGIPAGALSLFSAALGALVCGTLTFVVSRSLSQERFLAIPQSFSFILPFVPALVLSTIWTAARGHDYIVQAVSIVFLMLIVGSGAFIRSVRICSAALAFVVAIMSYDTHFEFPVNVLRLLAVGLVMIWSVLLYVQCGLTYERNTTDVDGEIL